MVSGLPPRDDDLAPAEKYLLWPMSQREGVDDLQPQQNVLDCSFVPLVTKGVPGHVGCRWR